MQKKIGIIHKNLLNGFIQYFYNKDTEIILFDTIENIKGCDLIALYDYNEHIKTIDNIAILNLHPSLLPAFAGKDASKRAFESGVKVSGITIQNQSNGKIIAQYPVFIGLTTSYNDYMGEISAITNKIYPIVCDAILNDRVFDFAELLNTGCNGNCSGGCNGCSH